MFPFRTYLTGSEDDNNFVVGKLVTFTTRLSKYVRKTSNSLERKFKISL